MRRSYGSSNDPSLQAGEISEAGTRPPPGSRRAFRIDPGACPSSSMTRIAHSEREIPREALAAAGVAATVAAVLAWFGPPGSDFAAHLYQSALFEDHGFGIWNNFWYAGRYSFVTYSLLYYPLAAFLGIKLLAVASIATAALAFGVVAAREWGPASRWSNRSFAVVWAGVVLSGAFPFALGMALALLALWALQAGRRGRFALLTVLVLAASPVAFVLLAVILAATGLSRAPRRAELALPLGTLTVAAGVELVLLRLFPAGGRFPFSLSEFAAACVFCGLGISLTWRVRTAGVLRWMYVVYLDRLHRRVPGSVRPGREHRATAVCSDPDRDPDTLPATLASSAARRPRALARGRLEPHPARRQLRQDQRGTGGRSGVLGPRGAVPPRPSLPVVPRRGGRHRRPLARCLPSCRGHSDRARLVPAGRLPA